MKFPQGTIAATTVQPNEFPFQSCLIFWLLFYQEKSSDEELVAVTNKRDNHQRTTISEQPTARDFISRRPQMQTCRDGPGMLLLQAVERSVVRKACPCKEPPLMTQISTTQEAKQGDKDHEMLVKFRRD